MIPEQYSCVVLSYTTLDGQEKSGCSSEPSKLVAVAFLLAPTLGCLDADLLVVLLECRQVLARLGEFALLHALSDIPVHERALRVHQIELVVDAREDFCDRGRIALHAHGTHYLGKVAAWNHRGWLVVDSTLGTGRAPVHELDGALRPH